MNFKWFCRWSWKQHKGNTSFYCFLESWKHTDLVFSVSKPFLPTDCRFRCVHTPAPLPGWPPSHGGLAQGLPALPPVGMHSIAKALTCFLVPHSPSFQMKAASLYFRASSWNLITDRELSALGQLLGRPVAIWVGGWGAPVSRRSRWANPNPRNTCQLRGGARKGSDPLRQDSCCDKA